MQDLKLVIIQTDIVWENIQANLTHIENKFLNLLKKGSFDLIVLPEMFDTGFSMNSEKLAALMQNQTIDWMKNWALKLDCEIIGSKIIADNNAYYNRLLVVCKDGLKCFYDKRHLFRMADEDKHFKAGNKRVIYEIKGWKILLQICYDLRFPVFSRNRLANNLPEYDAIIYVANWPEKRAHVWQTLIKARAIENQAYCIGVNRVGVDGNNITYQGDSAVIDPWGNVVINFEDEKEGAQFVTIQAETLDKIREVFPAYKDGDGFNLQITQ